MGRVGSGHPRTTDCGLTEFGGGDVDGGAGRAAADAGDGEHSQLVRRERTEAAHRPRGPPHVASLAPLGLVAVAGATAAAPRRRRVLGAELDDVVRHRLDVARVPAQRDRVGRHVRQDDARRRVRQR